MAKAKKELQGTGDAGVQGRRFTTTEQQRSLQARLAAYALHSRYDGRDITAAARRAFLDRFERQVDPDGVLSPSERKRRAEIAKKAYFTRLGQKSGAARRRG
jgi:tellurite resistance protein